MDCLYDTSKREDGYLQLRNRSTYRFRGEKRTPVPSAKCCPENDPSKCLFKGSLGLLSRAWRNEMDVVILLKAFKSGVEPSQIPGWVR